MGEKTGEMIDRYKLVELLGEGGMASVYKAFDTRLERYVALKVIRSQIDAPEFIKRFDREAKALAQLSHPHIVKVLDYGEYQAQPYLVMEYISGGTLKEKLGSPMPFQDALRLVIPVAQALCHAHKMKIIHRDVKPANILLTDSANPMLTDFGIAKVLEAGEGDLTATGVGIGTPEYMAPEKGMGQAVDPRMDIYALGVVLYELVTGKKPFQANTPLAVVMKHISEPLPRPKEINPSIPDQLEGVICRALAKKPEERYPDMAAFLSALEDTLASVKTRTIPVSDTIRPPRAEYPTSPPVQTWTRPAEVLTPAQVEYPKKKKSSFPVWAIFLLVVAAFGLVGGAIAVTAGAYWFTRSKATPTQEMIVQEPTQTQIMENTQMVQETPSPSPAETEELIAETPEMLVFTDDFSDLESGWEVGDFEGGSVGYKGERYFVYASTENMVMWGAAGKNYKDVIIEVDSYQVFAPGNNNNDYGVMCRVQVNGDGYSFSVSGDGFYTIQKLSGESYTDLVEWASSPAIVQGNESNHIKAVCEGDYLALYVNDVLLAEAHDSEFSHGDIALTATSYEVDATEIQYDNLVAQYR